MQHGRSDDELTAGSYDSIYGFHGDKEYKGVFNDNDLSTDGSKVLSRPLANGSPGISTRTPGMARLPAV